MTSDLAIRYVGYIGRASSDKQAKWLHAQALRQTKSLEDMQALDATLRERIGTEQFRRMRVYWQHVASWGVPHADRDAITCEGDNGYGPCGQYTDWGKGRCREGHKIEFAERN